MVAPPKPYKDEPLSTEAKAALISMVPPGGVASVASSKTGLQSIEHYATQGLGLPRTWINDYLGTSGTMKSRIPSLRERMQDKIRENIGGEEESKQDRTEILSNALEYLVPPIGVATGMEDASESYDTGHPIRGTIEAAMALAPGPDPKIKHSLTKQGFFSPAMEAVANSPQKKFTPEQAVKLLTGPNSGIKREELQETGVLHWIEGMKELGEPITKENLSKVLDSSRIKLHETRYSHASPNAVEQKIIDEDRKAASTIYEKGTTPDPYGPKDIYETPSLNQTWFQEPQHGSYVLPTNAKGDTYKEIVMSLPLDKYMEGGEKGPRYTHTHWGDVDNPLVHIRMQDRVDPQDGGKVLSIEEIQSDWGQSAHKQIQNLAEEGIKVPGWRGTKDRQISELTAEQLDDIRRKETALGESDEFKDYWNKGQDLRAEKVEKNDQAEALRNEFHEVFRTRETPERSAKLKEITENFDRVRKNISSVEERLRVLKNTHPYGIKLAEFHAEKQNLLKVQEALRNAPAHAPYIGDTNKYVDLALKRTLIEAARGDYDKVLLVPGEVHAKRWTGDGREDQRSKGLLKHYDEVIPNRMGDLIRKLDKKAQLVELDTGQKLKSTTPEGHAPWFDHPLETYAPSQLAEATKDNVYSWWKAKYPHVHEQDLFQDFRGYWTYADSANELKMEFLYDQYRKHEIPKSELNETIKARGFVLTSEMKKKILEGLSIMSLGGVTALGATQDNQTD